ncbi:uncharacterized protein LOC135698255 [Ochlerotatus camptorhynchus]|uniref:uncharacterized protein LOC135698255 n=1 Tax=Ochlerotatus camptorhynchus TaxID=644619 RepID=UPI0031E35F1F
MISPPGSRNSAIDVTLVTPGIARKAHWSVKEEEFGSVHMSIHLEISSDIPKVERTIKRINKEALINQLNTIRPQFLYSPEEMVTVFNEAVEKASFSFKNKKANFLKTWWTDEITKLYTSKREALREYNRQKTTLNFIRLKKERALFKKEVRKTKRRHVRELTEKIDESTPPRQLWNLVKGIDTALTGNHRKSAEITREEGINFMNHYFQGRYREIPLPVVSTERSLEGYEMAIKEGEILSVLRQRKNHSAAGPNGMSYAVIKQLNPGMQSKICEMLSRVFVSEEIPDQWRYTEIKPIPKKTCSPDSPNSMRPIALMNIEIKLINSAIKNRLAEIATIKDLIPQLSFGFRKHVSASTCINYVVNSIHKAKEEHKEAFVIFLDTQWKKLQIPAQSSYRNFTTD